MWSLLAEGAGYEITSVVAYENEVEEGQRAKLRLYLNNPLNPSSAQDLQDQLEAEGVEDVEVISIGNTLEIIYRKNPFWLAVMVPIIIALLVVLAIIIVSWMFFKEIMEAGPMIGTLLAVGFAAFGVGLVIYLARR